MTAQSNGSLASLDGEIMLASEAQIPASDDGFLRGDGVFDAARIYDGRLFAFEDHLRRLERSASNIRLSFDTETVRADAYRLVAEAGIGPDHQVLRIILTRGGRRLLLTEPIPELPEQLQLATITFAPSRVLDGVKSLSYGANMLARRLARERGCDDALLVTPHGRVLEAPTASIFWVAGGAVRTPPLDEHILASITRRIVIEETGAVEQSVSLDEFLAADEVFLASTVREVHPVRAIDGLQFAAPGPISAEIAEKVSARIRSELAAAG
ncbi:MAG TPA: aminotransferase class IV [Solirubrobacteraceae bacterium]|nr:aminotransferase class IV [Solirubrobacteraceae bacterium]